MEIREVLKTAIVIMDEKGRSDGNNKMLWARDWEHLRELLIVGLVSIANKPGAPAGIEPSFDKSSDSLTVDPSKRKHALSGQSMWEWEYVPQQPHLM